MSKTRKILSQCPRHPMLGSKLIFIQALYQFAPDLYLKILYQLNHSLLSIYKTQHLHSHSAHQTVTTNLFYPQTVHKHDEVILSPRKFETFQLFLHTHSHGNLTCNTHYEHSDIKIFIDFSHRYSNRKIEQSTFFIPN